MHPPACVLLFFRCIQVEQNTINTNVCASLTLIQLMQSKHRSVSYLTWQQITFLFKQFVINVTLKVSICPLTSHRHTAPNSTH